MWARGMDGNEESGATANSCSVWHAHKHGQFQPYNIALPASRRSVAPSQHKKQQKFRRKQHTNCDVTLAH